MLLLNRIFRFCARIYFAIVGLAIATIFLLMALSMVFKGQGSVQLQRLIHSDGFFPWPVAAMFSLMELAPWVMGIGFAGAVIGWLLRRMLFRDSTETTGTVLSIVQTGTKVNQRPQMRMRLAVGDREISLKALIDLGNIPRPGDTVRLQVSRADPSFVRYAGLLGPAAAR